MISLLSNMDISPQNKENSIFKIRMGNLYTDAEGELGRGYFTSYIIQYYYP